MRIKINLKRLVIFLVLLAFGSPGMAEMKEVCFKHKTRDTIKTDCRKIKGKHDAFAVFKCFDKKGDLKEFIPGDDWIEIGGDDSRCAPEPDRTDEMRGENNKKKDKGDKK